MDIQLFLADLFIVVIEGSLIYWVMQSFFPKRINRVLAASLYVFFIVAGWFPSYYFGWHWAPKSLLNLTIMVLLSIFAFKRTWWRKFFSIIGVSLVLLLTETALIKSAKIFGYGDVAKLAISNFAWIVASRVICASILGAVVMVHRRKEIDASQKIRWVSLLSTFITPIIIAIILIDLFPFIQTNDEFTVFSFCSFLLVILYIILTESHLRQIEVLDTRNKAAFFERETKIRKEQEEAIRDLNKEVHTICHDVSTYISAAQAVFEEGRVDIAQEMLDKMRDRVQSTLDRTKFGNVMLDTLLKDYEKQASALGIEITCETNIQRELEIEMIDISGVIGNAFSNALESCERIMDSNKQKCIRISVLLIEEILMINIENTIGGTINKQGEKFLTSKADKAMHGIGLSSIKHTVEERYKGLLEIVVENGWFKLTATMQNKKI